MGSSSGLIALLALGIGAALLLWLFLRRSGETARRIDNVLAETAAARAASEAVDRRFDEMRRAVEDRVGGVERSLAEGQKALTTHLGESGRLLQDVGEKMGRIFEASQRIEKLSGEVTRLEDLLKPPKLRGTLGETFLEQALQQALPPGSWERQYRFVDGATVDVVVRISDRCVPIDSKFPLENYRKAHEAEGEEERRRARTAFASDVRRHADSISRKYIRPEEGTCDYAFMYVPAEAVYGDLVGDGEGNALADYCLERRVFPVSPRLFYAFLSTVAMVLRGGELQRNAREIHERVLELERLWERAGEPFKKLGVHLGNAQKQYEDAQRALGRFGERLSGVTEGAQEKLDVSSDTDVSLLQA